MRWLYGPVRREEYFALAVWVNAGSSFQYFSGFFLRISSLYVDFPSSSFSDFDLMAFWRLGGSYWWCFVFGVFWVEQFRLGVQ